MSQTEEQSLLQEARENLAEFGTVLMESVGGGVLVGLRELARGSNMNVSMVIEVAPASEEASVSLSLKGPTH